MTDLLTETDDQLILASKTKRFFASLIDYIIFYIGFYFIAKYFGQSYTSEEGSLVMKVEGSSALGCMVFWFAILALMERLANRQSIGKMIFGLRVVKPDGTNASLGNTTVRHLFDLIDFLPFFGIVGMIVASQNNRKQRVGDLVAKTIVIEK
jgi:uncharacterized RDD family membrane protein YckC